MGTGGGGRNAADIALRVRLEGEQEFRKAEKGLEGVGEAAKGAAKAQGELTQASEQTANVGEQLTGVFDAMDAKLGEFGLNIRAVTVALGAGLAGGVTAFLRAAVVGTQAVVGLISNIIEENRRFQRDTDLAFGQAGESVRNFAHELSRGLRISRTELTDTLLTVQQFANVLRIPVAAQVEFTRGLTELAAHLANITPGFDGPREAAKAFTDAINGSETAVAELGIQLQDLDQLAQSRFQKAADALSPWQRQILLTVLAQDRLSDSVGNALRETRGFSEQSNQVAISMGRWLGVELNLRDSTAQLTTTLQGLRAAEKQLGGQTDSNSAIRRKLIELLEKELAARNALNQGVDESTRLLRNEALALQLTKQAFLNNTSQVRQAEDAFRSLDRARVDGARQVQEAQIRLSRAIEDALHRETELRIRNARAAEDAARDIGRALEDIARAQEQNTLSLASAQARFEEAQIQSFRAIRTAQERLEDFLRDSARRREDIQRRIARAREQEVKDLTEAIIAIEDAQREGDAEGENRARRNLARLQQEERGNKALEDALRDLARLQEDTVRQRQRLERALLESQLDAGRRQQQASRDLARARIEANNRIIEAERRLQDATQRQSRAAEDAARSMARLAVENQRAIADAQRAIENASRNMARSVDDASRALQRMAQDLGLTVEMMRRLIQQGPAFLAIMRVLNELNQLPGFENLSPAHFGFRQHGGRFQFGQPFIAGEVGPELVIPDQSGRVLSNEELVRLMRDSGGGSGGPSITINEVAGDPEATAFAVNSRLARGIS